MSERLTMGEAFAVEQTQEGPCLLVRTEETALALPLAEEGMVAFMLLALTKDLPVAERLTLARVIAPEGLVLSAEDATQLRAFLSAHTRYVSHVNAAALATRPRSAAPDPATPVPPPIPPPIVIEVRTQEGASKTTVTRRNENGGVEETLRVPVELPAIP